MPAVSFRRVYGGIKPSRGRWRLATGLLVPLSPVQAGQLVFDDLRFFVEWLNSVCMAPVPRHLSPEANERFTMRTSDLIKATVGCGLAAYLVFEFPVLGQVVIIGVLSLLWLSYLYSTVMRGRVR